MDRYFISLEGTSGPGRTAVLVSALGELELKNGDDKMHRSDPQNVSTLLYDLYRTSNPASCQKARLNMNFLPSTSLLVKFYLAF